MGKKLAIFHGLVAAHFAYACYYDWNYVEQPYRGLRRHPIVRDTGKFLFLTFWNAVIQAEYYMICFINDILGRNDDTPKKLARLRKLQDLIFSSLAFPLSLFVGLTFWTLFIFDRELVFPKAFDKYFPLWIIHAMHTNIVIFSFMELFFQCRRYPSRKTGVGILFSVMMMYLIWIHVIYRHSGIWVYPVLAILQLYQKIVFIVALFALGAALYAMGDKLNTLIWRKQLASSKSSRRKRAEKNK